MSNLKNALSNLGVRGHITVRTYYGRAAVYVNNKYFGIWDDYKKTFVD